MNPKRVTTAAAAAVLAAATLVVPTLAATSASAAGYPRSEKVALVPDAYGRTNNGGTFPTSGFPDSYAPAFTNVPIESIRDDATDPLAGGGFDTVVLNSVCDIAAFLSNAQFKTRVESFVSTGGKLIIWDSECQATDYSDFAIPFQTSNPGALGLQGTLVDVEENTLSSQDSASPNFIDVAAVANQTDAVGDANVFTTYDPRWFVDLRATNAIGVDGPVQAYANLGSGLIIYSGLDKDFLPGGSFSAAAGDGPTHLNRIWLLELLQPWDPDGLPNSTPATGNSYDYVKDGVIRVANIGDSFSSGEGLAGGFPEAKYDCGTDLPKLTNGYYKGTNVQAPAGRLSKLPGGFSPSWPNTGCQTETNTWSEPSWEWWTSKANYENKCHRSGTAYGPMTWERLGVKEGDGLFIACSGAKVRHIGFYGDSAIQYPLSPYGVAGGNTQATDLGNFSDPAQGGAAPDIITLSVGGNDLGDKAGVSDVMKTCATKGCQRQKLMNKVRNDISVYLDQTVAEVRAAYPSSRIIVVGYPWLFGPPVTGKCEHWNSAASLFISQSERTWIDETLIPALNNAVRNAASMHGASYLDTYNKLGSSHGICAKDNWINGFLPETWVHSGHPSQEWHARVADLVLDELARPSVDLDTACRIQYQATGGYARLKDETDAASWECWNNVVTGSGVNIVFLGGVDVDRACQFQYGETSRAALGSASDPYSWYCRI